MTEMFENIGDYNLCDSCKTPCGKDVLCEKCEKERQKAIHEIFGKKSSINRLKAFLNWFRK